MTAPAKATAAVADSVVAKVGPEPRHVASLLFDSPVFGYAGIDSVLAVQPGDGQTTMTVLDKDGRKVLSAAVPNVEIVDDAMQTDDGWLVLAHRCVDEEGWPCGGTYDLVSLDNDLRERARSEPFRIGVLLVGVVGEKALVSTRIGDEYGVMSVNWRDDMATTPLWMSGVPVKQTQPSTTATEGKKSVIVGEREEVAPVEETFSACVAGDRMYTWQWDDSAAPAARVSQIDVETGRVIASTDLKAGTWGLPMCSEGMTGQLQPETDSTSGPLDLVTISFNEKSAAPVELRVVLPFTLADGPSPTSASNNSAITAFKLVDRTERTRGTEVEVDGVLTDKGSKSTLPIAFVSTTGETSFLHEVPSSMLSVAATDDLSTIFTAGAYVDGSYAFDLYRR